VTIVNVRQLITATLAAVCVAPAALAELPLLDAAQVIEPKLAEVESSDPTQPPETPFFGSDVAMQGTVALVGMPGAFGLEGRVAMFTRNSAGTWVRSATLKATDAARGAQFGLRVALSGNRALIASSHTVYAFARSSGVWRQMQKFTYPVDITDLEWHGDLAVVGSSAGAYLLNTNANGTGQVQRIGRLIAHDTRAADRFGSRVAIYGQTLVVTAPGYHSDQGAAYVYSCAATVCRERQKLLANDGAPGAQFGDAVDVRRNVILIGAPRADLEVGDAESDPSSTNYRAGGAGYIYLLTNGTWTETHRLRPTANEANWYWNLGYEVALSDQYVLISAPFPIERFETGMAFVYQWSGSSLIAKGMLMNDVSHGVGLAIYGTTALVGTPDGAWSAGTGEIYRLSDL
jgi:hypothetical protein